MASPEIFEEELERVGVRGEPVSAAVSDKFTLRPILTHPLGRLAGQIVIVAILLAFWEFGSGWFLPRVWVSTPSAIFLRLLLWVRNGMLWRHLAATLSSAGMGYALGSISGIASGLAIGLSPRAERVLSPFIIALYALPKVALAPFFVIFLGIGLESKIALVSMTVYFLLLYNTLDGLHDLDRGWAEAFRVMGASRQEIVRRVLLPGIAPWILSGLRIAVRYAFTAAVLGEMIAGNEGIGYLIDSSAGAFNSSGIFAGVLLLVICSLTATHLISRAERTLLRWRP